MNNLSVFEKTERVLYNYPLLCKAVEMGCYENAYVPSEGGKLATQKTPLDYKKQIEMVLENVKNDPFYSVLELWYFEQLTREEIAIRLNCSSSTVRRNKNRLINKLAVLLFPAETMSELLN